LYSATIIVVLYNQIVMTMNAKRAEPGTTALALQEQMQALVRAFGLHRPETTPCGKPLSVAEAYALQELRRDASFAQGELAERLNLEKSTISRLVAQLEGRGWVLRQRSPEDGRVQLLSLTDAGTAIADNVATARREKFARVLEALPTDARDDVIAALQTLVEAIRASS
jgi:DNA-binding MarR family transcriptional regulator